MYSEGIVKVRFKKIKCYGMKQKKAPGKGAFAEVWLAASIQAIEVRREPTVFMIIMYTAPYQTIPTVMMATFVFIFNSSILSLFSLTTKYDVISSKLFSFIYFLFLFNPDNS